MLRDSIKESTFKRSKTLSLLNLQGVVVGERPQERTVGRHRLHSQCSSKLKPIRVEFDPLGLTLIIFLIAVTKY